MVQILEKTALGLYCRIGDFFVDPQQPVERAVISHAHSDHARWGCRHYLSSREGEQLLRMRLSSDAEFQFLDYGKSISIHGVRISFHPAGHILGSSQVRLEYHGRIEVVSGDYKLEHDATCTPWEPVACHRLVTESTFGLPVYRWESQAEVFASINHWWQECRDAGKCSVLYGYAVGKSQRLLAGLDATIGNIFTHGAVEKGVAAYRRSGVQLPPTRHVGEVTGRSDWRGAMILAVPSAHGTPWLRKFGAIESAMASGWMAIRGARRRRSVDRGFVLSDHVDWPSLLTAVKACDPEEVWVTHGYAAVVARYLQEQGRNAISIDSNTRSEEEDEIASEIVGSEVEAVGSSAETDSTETSTALDVDALDQDIARPEAVEQSNGESSA